MADTSQIEEEVDQLRFEIVRLGKKQDDGKYIVTFGDLFDDDRC